MLIDFSAYVTQLWGHLLHAATRQGVQSTANNVITPCEGQLPLFHINRRLCVQDQAAPVRLPSTDVAEFIRAHRPVAIARQNLQTFQTDLDGHLFRVTVRVGHANSELFGYTFEGHLVLLLSWRCWHNNLSRTQLGFRVQASAIAQAQQMHSCHEQMLDNDEFDSTQGKHGGVLLICK
jgi:hypothetical protein